MRERKILRGATLALIVIAAMAVEGFSQAQPVAAPSRISQQIIVNGQQANGAYVTTAADGMQRYTCPNPQSYSTPDGASSGWACYDQATSTYLLNALPPAAQASTQPIAVPQSQAPAAPATAATPASTSQVPVQQPATVVYQQPAAPVVYAPAPYPYPYPVYAPYPPVVFGVGFGFGPRFIGSGFYGPRFGMGVRFRR